MAKKYKRFHEIPMQKCNGECPGKGEEVLKITLFHQYAKLRSHAVKHLANKKEPYWTEKLEADTEIIDRSIADLQNIACPYFTAILPEPPCKGCALSQKCNVCTAKLENEYLRIIRNVLEEGCAKPRYSCFHSKKMNNSLFLTMPDKPVITKSALLDNDDAVYNLMTVYTANAGITFSEMLKKQREKIANEAKTNSIHWCNPVQWGFVPFQPSKTVKGDWREALKKMGEEL